MYLERKIESKEIERLGNREKGRGTRHFIADRLQFLHCHQRQGAIETQEWVEWRGGKLTIDIINKCLGKKMVNWLENSGQLWNESIMKSFSLTRPQPLDPQQSSTRSLLQQLQQQGAPAPATTTTNNPVQPLPHPPPMIRGNSGLDQVVHFITYLLQHMTNLAFLH